MDFGNSREKIHIHRDPLNSSKLWDPEARKMQKGSKEPQGEAGSKGGRVKKGRETEKGWGWNLRRGKRLSNWLPKRPPAKLQRPLVPGPCRVWLHREG